MSWMSEAVNPGDVLDGKYVVERVLGSGGMGMVVAARHVDLGQRVAVKFMLREAMRDASNVDRFKREARAAVQLRSLHTARVIDVGQLRNGEPYMVMEYLEGHDLDEEIHRRGTMPVHEAVDYVLQASEAIAEAHGLGMIHRDIKPKNLFLTRSVDGRPLVKVLDFGLAKNIGGKTDVSLTATTAVFGSPQYMSPEQMRSAKDADTRSDVWSLGVCLYELLTGRIPFDAPGVAEICAMVLKDPVPPPRVHKPDLPPHLEAVVMRALEKDPSRRYQSVAELAMALEPFAVEGSGRRILAVMETASRPILPTQVRSGPLPTDEQIVKTISSWDSGEQARLGGSSATSRRALGMLLGIAAAGVILGVGAAGYMLLKSRPHSAVAATDTASAAPPPALPPTPDPVPASTAPAAAPSPAASSEPAPDPAGGKAGAPAAAGKTPKHAGATKPPAVTTAKPPPQATAPAAPAATGAQNGPKKTWDSL